MWTFWSTNWTWTHYYLIRVLTLIPSCSVERCNKVPRVRVFQVSLLPHSSSNQSFWWRFYVVTLLIKVYGGVFMLSRCFLDCSVGVGVFVTGLSQISSFFYEPSVSKWREWSGDSHPMERITNTADAKERDFQLVFLLMLISIYTQENFLSFDTI